MSSKQYHKFFLAAVLAIVLGALLLLGLTQKSAAPSVVFTDLSGNRIAMESLRGKMVLVNFWATSCPGCVKEMPELIETYQRYRGHGFELVAVAMSYDPPSYVLRFVRERALPFPVALDVQGELARAFGDVKLTPTAFLIDKEGHVVEQTIGELDFARLHARLDKELKG